MTTWSLDIFDLSNASVLANVPFKSLTASWVLNAPGSLEFDVNYRGGSLVHPTYDNLAMGKRIAKLSRNGAVIWGGWLNDVSASANKGVDGTVQCQCDGWWWRTRNRVVDADLIYTDGSPTSQQQIAWNIINHIQGQTDGYLGFSQGTHVGATVNRSRHYCGLTERPNAGQAVEDFTALDDGFDFEINPATRAFNTWSSQRKTDLSGSIILNSSNLMSLSWQESAREMVNVVSGIGADDCGPIISDVTDATFRGTYLRLQDIVQSDKNKKGEIDSQSREELRSRKRGIFTALAAFYEVAGPAWGTYGLGDLVTLAPDSYFSSFNKAVRVSKISLTLEPNAAASANAWYELDLTSAKD